MIRKWTGVFLSFTLFNGFVQAGPVSTTSITFQNGVDSYSGTFDRRIGPGYTEVDGSAVNTDVSSYFIDGGVAPDFSNGLIRFDGIIGGSSLPAGAKIITADLEVRTTSSTASTNSQTGGAYNVYTLNTPFDSSSSTTGDFGADGIAGNVSGIVGSFDGMTVADTVVNARVDRAVQNWVDGGTNYGLGIRSDRTTDGWSVNTTGAATAANFPKLNVTYTTDPRVDISSYTPSVDSFPNGSTGGTVGTIVDGSTIAEGFLDGSDGGSSFDQPYLVRFDGLDLNFASIYRAELVFVTGFSSSAADSPDAWTVHQMLADWNGTTSYASLDSDSNPALNNSAELIAAGTIAPAAATVPSANDTEVIHLDVTSIVQAWLSGDPNYGFYVGSGGTANGWQIFTSGAPDGSMKPELRIIGVRVPEPSTLILCGLGFVALCGRRYLRRK